MLTLLCLCACGKQSEPMQPALDLRTALLEQGCSFTACLQADFESGSCEWTASCVCAPDGSVTMELTQPESIAGITATVAGDGQSARFDGTAVEFGLLADGNLAPIALPQVLYSCWSSQYIREAGRDGETVCAVYLMGYGDEEIAVEQWLQPDGTPLFADVWYGETKIASVQISDFQLGTTA